MTAQFRVRGWHVLTMFLAFFAAIIAANAIFITLAVRTFPGEEEKKSYLQGLNYNDRLAERAVQDALGWSAEIAHVRRQGGEPAIELSFVSAAATPLTGLRVSGKMSGLVDDKKDRMLDFVEVAPGVYQAATGGSDSGAWRLKATATGPRGETFTLAKRITFR